MIESDVNNRMAVSLRQSQSQDIRSIQSQQEVSQSVEEQASSRPVASSGVQAADTVAASVSTQPSDVVTRLGETSEQVPLYDANRPSGTIIRPAIEIAQNQQSVSQPDPDQQLAEQRMQAQMADNELQEPGSPAQGRDPDPDDVQNMS